MSDRYAEVECYECGRLKTRIIWQGRCVTCTVQRLESNLEENDAIRSDYSALKEENEDWRKIAADRSDAIKRLTAECAELQEENERLKARVAELEEGIARCRQQASYCIGNEEALKNQLSKVRDIAKEVLISKGASREG